MKWKVKVDVVKFSLYNMYNIAVQNNNIGDNEFSLQNAQDLS